MSVRQAFVLSAHIPAAPFPETTFRVPAASPPTVLLGPWIRTPHTRLLIAAVPAAFRPMRLPYSVLWCAPWEMRMPFSLLPEITLPSPALVPPIVLLLAKLATWIPWLWFAHCLTPLVSTPM